MMEAFWATVVTADILARFECQGIISLIYVFTKASFQLADYLKDLFKKAKVIS